MGLLRKRYGPGGAATGNGSSTMALTGSVVGGASSTAVAWVG